MTIISYDKTDKNVVETVLEMKGVTIDSCSETDDKTTLTITIQAPFDDPEYPVWYGETRIKQVQNVIEKIATGVQISEG